MVRHGVVYALLKAGLDQDFGPGNYPQGEWTGRNKWYEKRGVQRGEQSSQKLTQEEVFDLGLLGDKRRTKD
jgi:hypothetical protein